MNYNHKTFYLPDKRASTKSNSMASIDVYGGKQFTN